MRFGDEGRFKRNGVVTSRRQRHRRPRDQILYRSCDVWPELRVSTAPSLFGRMAAVSRCRSISASVKTMIRRSSRSDQFWM